MATTPTRVRTPGRRKSTLINAEPVAEVMATEVPELVVPELPEVAEPTIVADVQEEDTVTDTESDEDIEDEDEAATDTTEDAEDEEEETSTIVSTPEFEVARAQKKALRQDLVEAQRVATRANSAKNGIGKALKFLKDFSGIADPEEVEQHFQIIMDEANYFIRIHESAVALVEQYQEQYTAVRDALRRIRTGGGGTRETQTDEEYAALIRDMETFLEQARKDPTKAILLDLGENEREPTIKHRWTMVASWHGLKVHFRTKRRRPVQLRNGNWSQEADQIWVLVEEIPNWEPSPATAPTETPLRKRGRPKKFRPSAELEETNATAMDTPSDPADSLPEQTSTTQQIRETRGLETTPVSDATMAWETGDEDEEEEDLMYVPDDSE